MGRLSANEFATKWAARTAAATDDYKKGVQKVTQAPSQAAIAQQAVMVTNFNDAVNSGKWAQNLSKVSLQQWQQASVEKGAQALAASVRTAQAKVQAAEAVNGPIRDSIVAGLPARGTLEENIARSAKFARDMANAKRS